MQPPFSGPGRPGDRQVLILFASPAHPLPSTIPMLTMQSIHDYRKEFIYGTIGLNALVFTQWHPIIPPHHDPISRGIYGAAANAIAANRNGVSTYLFDHFTLSEHNLRHGRWWTLVTNAFSHQNLPHLVSNMLGFFSAATASFDLGLGIVHMTALAVGSALAGSAATLAHERWVFGYQWNVLRYSLGASGMVYGLLVSTMLCAPRRTVFVGNVPVEQYQVTAWLVAPDVYELLWQSNHKLAVAGRYIGHAAHLGGAVFGAAYWWLFLRRGSLRRLNGGRLQTGGRR